MTERTMICPMMGGECIKDGAIRENADGKPELHACRFWVMVQGDDPQSGAKINYPDCSFAWFPMLMIENTKAQKDLAVEITELRNQQAADAQKVANVLQGFVGIARAMLIPRAAQHERVIEAAQLPPDH